MKNTLSTKKKAVMWLGRGLAVMSAAAMQVTAFADEVSGNNPDAQLGDVTTPIKGLALQIFNVLIGLVIAIGSIYCISLGVKFARAEEPQEREKAKSHLKNAIIGFLLIFILVVALRIGGPKLLDWMNSASPSSSSN